MLSLIWLAASLSGAPEDTSRTPYSSPALQSFIAEAALANRRVPASLEGYEARVESEYAVLLRQGAGERRTEPLQMEQLISRVRWARSEAFEQEVLGYRSRSASPLPSLVMRHTTLVPMLYGNRMELLFGRDSLAMYAQRPSRGADVPPVRTFHPLDEGRDSVYRFSGGDTVTTLRLKGRDIPISRVRVEPVSRRASRSMLFDGEIDFDAERRQIVRLRGRLIWTQPSASVGQRLRSQLIHAVAYIDLQNGEFDGRYWLPVYQHIEHQGMGLLLGDDRTILRWISRFQDHRLSISVDTASLPGDTLRPVDHRLRMATEEAPESVDWARGLGSLSAETAIDVFDEFAPRHLRPSGDPVWRFQPAHPSDLFRMNKIEGVYTGATAALHLRDRAPGTVLRGELGWAWNEQALRGRLSARKLGPGWSVTAAAGRSLETTESFGWAFEPSATLGMLLANEDPYDYVDRYSAGLSVERYRDVGLPIRWRSELAYGKDRAVTTHLPGWVDPHPALYANRGVAEGDYGLLRTSLEVNPDLATGLGLRSGVGAALSYEAAYGTLAWQRGEARLLARRDWARWGLLTRLDAGVVHGTAIPAQQLFEVGDRHLPGFGDRPFAGSATVLASQRAFHYLPVLREPVTVGRLKLPALAPTLSAGVHAGWVGAEGAGAQQALAARSEPVPELHFGPTGGIRGSYDLQLRLFGGAVSLVLARTTDEADPWRFGLQFGR
jgi:hypothetical protein